MHQVTLSGEDLKNPSLGEMPPFEDDEDNGVSVISYTGRESNKRWPPPMSTVEIEGTTTSALIDTGASVNVMGTAMLKSLATRPKVMPTGARIYTYGGTTPLPGVIEVTVMAEDRTTRTKFHVTKGESGTLLGCHTSEDLGLEFFAILNTTRVVQG